MNMDSQDKKKQSEFRRLKRSFSYAFQGIKYVMKHERNMQIHVIIAVLVLSLAIILSIPKGEMVLLLIVIGIVFSLETMNTAIERLVDLVTEDYHPLAKLAKDLSAAAVTIFVMIAVIIGIVIFSQPIYNKVEQIFF